MLYSRSFRSSNAFFRANKVLQAVRHFSESTASKQGAAEGGARVRTRPPRSSPPPRPMKKSRTGLWLLGLAIPPTVAAGTALYFSFQDKKQDVGALQPLKTALEPLSDYFREMRRDTTDAMHDWIAGPSSEKLLPDLPTPPPGYANPPTLVLDLSGTLVHSVWDRNLGWKIQKRPHLNQFLNQLSQYYELVLFTDGMFPFADGIVSQLDPNGQYFASRLYRDATTFKDGKYIKDLSKLNRDLSRVLIIDDEESSYEFQPQNAVHIKPFNGDKSDRELLDLLPFLEALAVAQVDFRTVLQQFGQDDVGKKFIQRQEEAKKAREKQLSQGLHGALSKIGFGRGGQAVAKTPQGQPQPAQAQPSASTPVPMPDLTNAQPPQEQQSSSWWSRLTGSK